MPRNAIKFKRLDAQAITPTYAHNFGDAAADLYSVEYVRVHAKERSLIRTGISMEIPLGYGGFIWDRSGLAVREGLTVLGGVIDSNYRGEIGVVLLNTGEQDYYVQPGDRIAQIAFFPVWTPVFDEVDELDDTERGEGAWGSTGK